MLRVTTGVKPIQLIKPSPNAVILQIQQSILASYTFNVRQCYSWQLSVFHAILYNELTAQTNCST